MILLEYLEILLFYNVKLVTMLSHFSKSNLQNNIKNLNNYIFSLYSLKNMVTLS